MRICIAQTRPVKGDIPRNINDHKKIIDMAVPYAADMVIFPELSITGYEPELAKELVVNADEKRPAAIAKKQNNEVRFVNNSIYLPKTTWNTTK